MTDSSPVCQSEADVALKGKAKGHYVQEEACKRIEVEDLKDLLISKWLG